MKRPTFPKLDGRAWGYIGTVVGATISIAANLGSALTRPHWVPAGQAWTPDAVAVITAPIWPALLFIAIEVLTKTNWPQLDENDKGRGRQVFWLAYRFLGVLPVGIVAGVISYQHLSQLLGDAVASYVQQPGHEESWWTHFEAWFGPVAIDGLMVLSAGALLLERKTKRPTRTRVEPKVDGSTAAASDNGKADGALEELVPKTGRRARRGPLTQADYELAALAAKGQIEGRGEHFDRASLVEELRREGIKVGTTRAADLMRAIKQDVTA